MTKPVLSPLKLHQPSDSGSPKAPDITRHKLNPTDFRRLLEFLKMCFESESCSSLAGDAFGIDVHLWFPCDSPFLVRFSPWDIERHTWIQMLTPKMCGTNPETTSP